MKKIGLLGLGTVGSGVYDIVQNRQKQLKDIVGEDVVIGKILDLRDPTPEEDASLFTKNYDDILNDPTIDVIVEVTGADEIAKDFMIRAMEHKKHVVTANKSVISAHMEELTAIADANQVVLAYEAAVGGAIPIIKPLKEEVVLNEVNEIEGILNGTCNYILTRMINEGLEYSDILKNAQDLGYAEANPSADVDGFDTQRKLRILATLAFGGKVSEEDIEVVGITSIKKVDIDYFKTNNWTVKLIAKAHKFPDNTYTAIVEPTIVPEGHFFSSVNMAFNAVSIDGDHVGELKFYGQGAGKLPTADAVLRDVLDIYLDSHRLGHSLGDDVLENVNHKANGNYYLRASGTSSFLDDLQKEGIRARRIYRSVGNLQMVFYGISRENVYAMVEKYHMKPEDYLIARLDD